jgi:hypothetical protein
LTEINDHIDGIWEKEFLSALGGVTEDAMTDDSRG